MRTVELGQESAQLQLKEEVMALKLEVNQIFKQ